MEYTIGTMVFGNWKIVNLIGRGSYGKVYEIQREDFGLTYRAALKVISVPQDENEVDSLKHEGMTESETTEYFYSMVQDIVNEFALMFDLKGTANIVGYEDHVVIKKEDGIGWDVLIRMELLTPLLDYASEENFTIQEVTKLGIDLCKALELCNKYKIIHRDLKPENIFVSKNGDYKIGDFGIARTIEKTMSGLSKKGTYSYMAPEVYKGQSYGYTVDIYSLGIVLYRLLNKNRLPFMPDAPAPIKYSDREIALTRRMNGEEIKLPFYHDQKLSEIVLKACAYNSKDRYATPTEMREALETITFIDGNKQVINTIEEDENTVSMLEEDENTVSMLEEDENTISTLEENQVFEVTNVTSKRKLSIKRKIIIVIASLILLFLMSTVRLLCSTYNAVIGYEYTEDSSTDVEEVISFSDKTLEKTIRLELGIWFRPIYTRDVEAITSVYLYKKDTGRALGGEIRMALNAGDITDISDFEYMKNIEKLGLYNSSGISDISALENLTNLTYLKFGSYERNPISDISVLENLTNLVYLDLSSKDISDISALENLTNLTYLDLGANDIDDISALGNLMNLTELHLDGNGISDISALGNLRELEELDLSSNDISDISGLENLTNLIVLDLGWNEISDISGLENLKKLEELHLDSNQISNVSALENLTNLYYLSIYGTPIEDYSPIEGLENTTIHQ